MLDFQSPLMTSLDALVCWNFLLLSTEKAIEYKANHVTVCLSIGVALVDNWLQPERLQAAPRDIKVAQQGLGANWSRSYCSTCLALQAYACLRTTAKHADFPWKIPVTNQICVPNRTGNTAILYESTNLI